MTYWESLSEARRNDAHEAREGMPFGTPMRRSIGRILMTPAERKMIPWLRCEDPSEADIPDTEPRWLELAGAAAGSGLAGLLLERARRIGVVPPHHAQQMLREASRAVAANNLHLTSELARIVAALQRADIPVMLLKGAGLIPTVYQQLDLRPMSDLDLLIPPKNVAEAVGVLTEIGCRSGQALIRDDFFPNYHYEIELCTGSLRPVRIDLHARPFRPLRYARTMSDDALWEGRTVVRVGDAEASIPGTELMFLHLAVHAAIHGFSRLIWLYDLKRFVEHFGRSMDWTLVTQRARRWRLSWPLSRAIEGATQSLGPLVPSCVIEELSTHRHTWRDRLALLQAPRDAHKPIAHILVNLLTTPGFRFKLGYVRALLFPGIEHLATIYPHRHRAWVFLAHGWRFVRAVGRLAAAAVGFLKYATTKQDRVPSLRPACGR